jgi:hypothetical protein
MLLERKHKERIMEILESDCVLFFFGRNEMIAITMLNIDASSDRGTRVALCAHGRQRCERAAPMRERHERRRCGGRNRVGNQSGVKDVVDGTGLDRVTRGALQLEALDRDLCACEFVSVNNRANNIKSDTDKVEHYEKERDCLKQCTCVWSNVKTRIYHTDDKGENRRRLSVPRMHTTVKQD